MGQAAFRRGASGTGEQDEAEDQRQQMRRPRGGPPGRAVFVAPQIEHGQTLHLGVRPERVLLFNRDGGRIRPRASVTPLRGYAS